MSDLQERLLAATREYERWVGKLAVNQVKTTADWHLYQKAEREYHELLNEWFGVEVA